MKRLLSEEKHPFVFRPIKKHVVEDKEKGTSNLIIEGIFGRLNAKNENNRIYPATEFIRNLGEGSPFQNRLKRRAVLGELEHPESGNTHLARVSHLITKAWTETLGEKRITELGYDTNAIQPGEYVLGRMEVLNTPNGQILRVLYESNVDVGVSSRGRGDTKIVDGVEEVFDYDLDTWDAVYLPSVVEAYPKVVSEADEVPLGDPDMSAESPVGVPPTTSPAVGTDWKPEAEELVRALETIASQQEPEVKEMVELQARGLNVVDTLAAIQDPEAVKLKSQAITLLTVINNRIMNIEVGKDASGTSVKKETIEEQVDIERLAKTASEERRRKGEGGPVFRGEIENILKKTGNEDTDDNVMALAARLRDAGLDVRQDIYESIEKVEPSLIQDGETILVNPKTILKQDEKINDEYMSKDLKQWLEKQEDEVRAIVCSRGSRGFIIRFFESPADSYDVFLPFDKVKKAQSEENKENENMKALELVSKLLENNEKLKKQVEGVVPEDRYEASKKLICALVERNKTADKKVTDTLKKCEASIRLLKKVTIAKREEHVPEKEEPGKTEVNNRERVAVTESRREVTRKPTKHLISGRSQNLRKRLAKSKLVKESKPPNLLSAVVHRISENKSSDS